MPLVLVSSMTWNSVRNRVSRQSSLQVHAPEWHDSRPWGSRYDMIRPYKGVLPRIPGTCYVDESAQIIGDVVLGEHASVWMNAVVRGDVHEIRIGAFSNIQDCSVLHGMKEQYGVYVGEYVTVGHNVMLHGC